MSIRVVARVTEEEDETGEELRVFADTDESGLFDGGVLAIANYLHSVCYVVEAEQLKNWARKHSID